MTTADWQAISVDEFDTLAGSLPSKDFVSHAILDRLPFIFESKTQYLAWRDALAEGLGVDGRAIALIGSAGCGRSLNPQKGFHQFSDKSDIDIAVISHHHFDIAWEWFRRTSRNSLNLDDHGKKVFDAHKSHYIFDGVIAADYFLGNFSFGQQWLSAILIADRLIPEAHRGRKTSARIYRDFGSLRQAQIKVAQGFATFREKNPQREASK